MFHITRFRRALDFITKDFGSIITDLKGLDHNDRPPKTNNALNRLYIAINQSIIAGEYIEDMTLVQAEIAEAKVNLTSLLTQVEQEVEDIQLSGIFYTFITVLENCLNSYSVMVMRVNNIFEVSKDVYLNKDNDREDINNQCAILLNKHNKITYPEFDKEKTYSAYKILSINIQLSLIDLSCNPNEKLLYKLNYTEDELNALYSDVTLKLFEFVFSIREKVKYIKLKVLIRFYQIQKELGSDLKIIQESRHTTIERLIDEIQFSELRVFLEYAYSHYIETKENDQKILNKYRSISNLPDNYFFRHLKIKYLKDLKRDKEGLQQLVIQFDEDYKNHTKSFDRYAKGVCTNYANNNLFSYSLEDINTEYDVALSAYEKVKRVSIETGINNYFPELRFLKFLIRKLNSLFEQKGVLKEVENINLYLKKCKDLIEIYKKNINWTKYNHSFIYQLPFEECTFSNSFTRKAKLRHFFTASTIVLPLDKEQNNLEYTEYFNQIKVFDSIKNTMNNLAVEAIKLETLNESIESKDVKYIEILGIFCAISTFISAAILSILSDKDSKAESVGNSDSFTFLLSTGIIMFAFLGLLVFIINKKTVSKRFSLVMLLILILLIVTCNNVGTR
jgi:hypothetical protein